MKKYAVLIVLALMFVPAIVFGQDYEPPKETPGWIATILSTVIGWFAPKYVVPFSAALGGVLIAIVGLVRQGLAVFGTKLNAKVIYLITGVLGLLTTVGTYASDGVLAGDEIQVIATTILSILAAALGYKLMFSQAARERLGK